MNWDAIGAIAEAIGAAGMIASLLYLASQVRAGARTAAVESKLASTRHYTDFLALLIQSPKLNDIFLRGRRDLGSLTKEEYYQFSNIGLKAFFFFSGIYFQYSHGTLNEADWFETHAVMRFWLRSPGCQEWWATVGRQMFGPDFVGFVDSELQNL